MEYKFLSRALNGLSFADIVMVANKCGELATHNLSCERQSPTL